MNRQRPRQGQMWRRGCRREPLTYDPQFFYDTIVDLMEQDAEDAE